MEIDIVDQRPKSSPGREPSEAIQALITLPKDKTLRLYFPNRLAAGMTRNSIRNGARSSQRLHAVFNGRIVTRIVQEDGHVALYIWKEGKSK